MEAEYVKNTLEFGKEFVYFISECQKNMSIIMKSSNMKKSGEKNMKTSKEFFERLQTDNAFANEVSDKLKTKAAAGETNYKSACISLAAEYGYELTEAELDEINEKASNELSDEELGKVSGGTTPICLMIGLGTLVTAATATYVITCVRDGEDIL